MPDDDQDPQFPITTVGPLRPLAVRPCDAARLLGVSEKTFRRLVGSHPVPSIKIGGTRGGARLFRIADLEQLLEQLVREQNGREVTG